MAAKTYNIYSIAFTVTLYRCIIHFKNQNSGVCVQISLNLTGLLFFQNCFYIEKNSLLSVFPQEDRTNSWESWKKKKKKSISL